ncbi:MAG: CDP-diacylglycerol O-phosphatidyltransferase [Tepidisphaera sp.]|nr:CDP-diacylglycerol O-phosphatidyltransferase [Tepidisphaera sp.]
MFLKLGPRKQEFPLAALIPNMLTTLALCCGLASLHFSLRGEWEKAMGAIVLSGVFDALDGRAARLLHVTSGFGAVLDSLSDFLAFGVAPAMLLHRWLQDSLTGRTGGFILAAVMTYALCAALRLARFTADVPAKPVPKGTERPADRATGYEKPAPYFVGMPTPAAAGCVMIPIMVARSDTLGYALPVWGVVVLAFVISFLMISRVPTYSLKALRIRRRWVAPMMVLLGLGVVGMMKDPWLTLSALAGVYLLSVPLTLVRGRKARRVASVDRSEPLPERSS